MDQSEIFRLLLVVLLLANKQLSPSQESEQSSFDYTAINDVLILTMLLRLFDSPGQSETDKNTTF